MYDNMRRLHPRGAASRGICVDAEGAMLGPGCVLVRRTPSGFRGIERDAVSTIQKCVLDADHDHDWLFRQCQRIADALNNGDLALAQIYGLRIPIGDLDGPQLKPLAAISGLRKVGFNPDEPRIPKGDHGGGEWTDGGSGDDGEQSGFLIDAAYPGTYHDPQYSSGQQVVYPMAQIGDHVYSPNPKIGELGFSPGQWLPPMVFVTIYKRDAQSPYKFIVHPDPIVP
jgi:hypothetical protein